MSAIKQIMLTLVARIFQIIESKKFEEISVKMGVFIVVPCWLVVSL